MELLLAVLFGALFFGGSTTVVIKEKQPEPTRRILSKKELKRLSKIKYIYTPFFTNYH